MVTCVVPGCDSSNNNNSQKCKFHIFPQDKSVREKWLQMINRGKWVPKKNSTICSKHFDQECFVQGRKRTNIRSGSIPTLFMPVVFKPIRKVSSYVYRDILPVPSSSTANTFIPDNTARNTKVKKTIDILKKRLVKKQKELKNVRAQRKRAIAKVLKLAQIIDTLESLPSLQNKLRVAYTLGTSVMACNNYGKCDTAGISYLSQVNAAALDQDLFTEYKFSVDQLMELAGLSVATAVAKVYPSTRHKSALIVCGPGNNGGDGLVAARHMTLFGYKVAIYYPKRTPKPLYENLLLQCEKFGVTVLEILPPSEEVKNEYQVLVDALFGFSFKPPVREELKPALNILIDSGVPVCSVDIPSGWDVEKGPPSEKSLQPALLISLSAPKLCAKPEILNKFNCKHYLGGRFLPPGILNKYNLTLPPYPAQDQVVEL